MVTDKESKSSEKSQKETALREPDFAGEKSTTNDFVSASSAVFSPRPIWDTLSDAHTARKIIVEI